MDEVLKVRWFGFDRAYLITKPKLAKAIPMMRAKLGSDGEMGFTKFVSKMANLADEKSENIHTRVKFFKASEGTPSAEKYELFLKNEKQVNGIVTCSVVNPPEISEPVATATALATALASRS